MTEHSERVGQLLAFARSEFGEHLSGLLLSGHVEAERRASRLYLAVFQDRGGLEEVRRLKMTTDDPSSLPSQYEPLVLIALLKLLWTGGGPAAYVVDYSQEAVLRMLGWPDDLQSRAKIDHAVERYYNLSMEVEAEEPGEAAAGQRQVGRIITQRMMIGYEYEEEGDVGEPGQKRECRVRFHPEFVSGLRSRSLLGLDWNSVASLRYSSEGRPESDN